MLLFMSISQVEIWSWNWSWNLQGLSGLIHFLSAHTELSSLEAHGITGSILADLSKYLNPLKLWHLVEASQFSQGLILTRRQFAIAWVVVVDGAYAYYRALDWEGLIIVLKINHSYWMIHHPSVHTRPGDSPPVNKQQDDIDFTCVNHIFQSKHHYPHDHLTLQLPSLKVPCILPERVLLLSLKKFCLKQRLHRSLPLESPRVFTLGQQCVSLLKTTRNLTRQSPSLSESSACLSAVNLFMSQAWYAKISVTSLAPLWMHGTLKLHEASCDFGGNFKLSTLFVACQHYRQRPSAIWAAHQHFGSRTWWSRPSI